MGLITAKRFNDLKAAVKAECERRWHQGGVSDYASSTYDYPENNSRILEEHFTKLAEPLFAISTLSDPETGFHISNPSNGDRLILEDEIKLMETKVDYYSSIGLTDDTSGCAAACTGLCTNVCEGGCGSSCGSDCTGKCANDCTGECKDFCGTSCSESCFDNCGYNCGYSDCTGGCMNSCGDGCQGSCGDDCARTCGDACETSCETACEYCTGTCTQQCAGGCDTIVEWDTPGL